MPLTAQDIAEIERIAERVAAEAVTCSPPTSKSVNALRVSIRGSGSYNVMIAQSDDKQSMGAIGNRVRMAVRSVLTRALMTFARSQDQAVAAQRTSSDSVSLVPSDDPDTLTFKLHLPAIFAGARYAAVERREQMDASATLAPVDARESRPPMGKLEDRVAAVSGSAKRRTVGAMQ